MTAFRIAPQAHDPVELDPRRTMTPRRRERILARQDGRCGYPGCEITSALEIDHTIALALGGKDADENLIGLCSAHHRQKTKLDMKLIAKAKRLEKRRLGLAKPKAPIRSAGWPKHIRKRMSGPLVLNSPLSDLTLIKKGGA